jgi:hypothetical protein
MGIIDHTGTANYDDIPIDKMDDQCLDRLEANIRVERARREERAKKPCFPLTWDGFRVYSTKDDRVIDAEELGLEGACARNFAYAGLELTFRVIIHENGDTVATHIRFPKTDEFLPLPAHIRLN